VTDAHLELLACPACRGSLAFAGSRSGARLLDGRLACRSCAAQWPIVNGVANLLDESRVGRDDRWMRVIYDWFACLHDPAVGYLLPLLQLGTERSLRDAYMRRLEVERLAPRGDGSPVRILEVSVGSGANLPLLRRDLPPGLPVEVWGLDLSTGMLAQCRHRLAADPGLNVELLVADAHALPFADAVFDRVFHVGGIAGFDAPARALAEMARVARAGTPIVVVDEQLDPEASRSLYYQLGYAVLAFFAPLHGAPVGDLPSGARDVITEQVSRFYYCLSFRM